MLLVNLGCGLNAPDEWVNIDRSLGLTLDRLPAVKQGLLRLGVLRDAHMARWPPNVRRHDVRKGLPFADSSVDAVYSSHMLEHMYRSEAQAVLVECHRVLPPRGVLRLALPDGEAWARGLLAGESVDASSAGDLFNRRLGAHPVSRPRGSERVRRLLGTGGVHLWQPTFDLVATMLSDTGFGEVERRSFLEGKLPCLEKVEHRVESLFVEAIR